MRKAWGAFARNGEVGGFEVAVDDTLRVGVGGGGGDLVEKLESAGGVEAGEREGVGERGAVDVFHGEKHPAVFERAAFQKADDVRMREGAERGGFVFEAFEVLDGGKARDFDGGDDAIRFPPGAPDDAEAAFAEDAFDFPAGDRRARACAFAENAEQRIWVESAERGVGWGWVGRHDEGARSYYRIRRGR